MSEAVKFEKSPLNLIQKGVNQLAKAVSLTYGHKCKNIVLRDRETRALRVTQSGSVVIKELVFQNQYEQLGAHLLKDGALRCIGIAGDGSKTAMIIADAIFTEGLNYLEKGVHPIELQRGIQKSALFLAEILMKYAVPLNQQDEIVSFATRQISNMEGLGKLIAESAQYVGGDGTVFIKPGVIDQNRLELETGMKIEAGFASPYFGAEKKTIVFKGASLLIADHELTKETDIMQLYKQIEKRDDCCQIWERGLLIIAPQISGGAREKMVSDFLSGEKKVCGVNLADCDEERSGILEDIKVLTGVSDNPQENQLGFVKRACISKTKTILIGGEGDQKTKASYLEELQFQRRHRCYSISAEKKMRLRYARFGEKVATLFIGKGDRYIQEETITHCKKAVASTQHALSSGVVLGRGKALLDAANQLDQLKLKEGEREGANLVQKAIEKVVYVGKKNSGKKEGETQIFDAAFVQKTALIQGASTAAMLLTMSQSSDDKNGIVFGDQLKDLPGI